MREAEMERVALLIDRVLTHMGNEQLYATVASDVEHLCLEFPLYPELQA
jgi:glycine/serine hydroxymethyltransferase